MKQTHAKTSRPQRKLPSIIVSFPERKPLPDGTKFDDMEQLAKLYEESYSGEKTQYAVPLTEIFWQLVKEALHFESIGRPEMKERLGVRVCLGELALMDREAGGRKANELWLKHYLVFKSYFASAHAALVAENPKLIGTTKLLKYAKKEASKAGIDSKTCEEMTRRMAEHFLSEIKTTH